jgi:hypothetical protein
MMLYLANLRSSRQQMIEMPAPSRWILAAAESSSLGPIDDTLDTAT